MQRSRRTATGCRSLDSPGTRPLQLRKTVSSAEPADWLTPIAVSRGRVQKCKGLKFVFELIYPNFTLIKRQRCGGTVAQECAFLHVHPRCRFPAGVTAGTQRPVPGKRLQQPLSRPRPRRRLSPPRSVRCRPAGCRTGQQLPNGSPPQAMLTDSCEGATDATGPSFEVREEI